MKELNILDNVNKKCKHIINLHFFILIIIMSTIIIIEGAINRGDILNTRIKGLLIYLALLNWSS